MDFYDKKHINNECIIEAGGPSLLIHIVIDDKFIDMGVRQFEEQLPGRNVLIAISNKRKLRHVTNDRIVFCTMDQAKSILNGQRCGAVIFHSLPDMHLPLLKNIPNEKPVVWLGWGYDYYDRLLNWAYPDGLLLEKTKEIKRELDKARFVSRAKSKLKALIKRSMNCSSDSPNYLLKRVNYFSPVLSLEFEMACQYNDWFRPQYLNWNYATLEDELTSFCDVFCERGDDILVGNSATPENNHAEIFDLLRAHHCIGDKRIIVPLSYGDANYAHKISEMGKEYFGDQFVPLLEYMPKDQYISLLNKCGFVFMNHLRQQGTGNIGIMLVKGAKVFMNPASPACQWFKENGAHITELTDLESSDHDVWQPLSDAERKNNYNFVNKNWGRLAQQEKTRTLINTILTIN